MGQILGIENCSACKTASDDVDPPESVVVDTHEQTPVLLRQAEGHPTVRVFASPEPGAQVVNEIVSGTHGILLGKSGTFCNVSVGSIGGWVGAKNVVLAGQVLSLDELAASDDTTKPPPMVLPVACFSKACPDGTMCKRREDDHLLQVAHPFDPEYAGLCAAAKLQPEMPSVVGLFQWIDKDGSGKISRKELEDALPQLSKLFEEEVTLTDKSWLRIDEDGNGAVNLSEFSCWAGPRLGLPLGVGHLFEGAAVDEAHGCAILGCPCEGFHAVERASEKVVRKQTEREHFFSRLAGSSTARTLSKCELGISSTQPCKCGHKFAAHRALEGTGEVPCPMYWDNRDTSAGEFTSLVPLLDEHALELFQDLFDTTYRKIYTRDRRKHHPTQPNVPKGFKVVRAFRSENSKIWCEYGVKRAQMLKEATKAPFQEYSDIISSIAWASHGGALADRLKPDINEWYLFHGSTIEAAEKICANDFRLQHAGKSTGSLYGRGIYFAESVTKADEYAKANADGEFAMLLCRVSGGHAKYTDEVEPDPEDLVRCCIEGPYDCIIGDRRKTRGTYREFVIYDSENVYAEYIIHYKRIY